MFRATLLPENNSGLTVGVTTSLFKTDAVARKGKKRQGD
jgi:hypothetical protein